jgi:hypothetical protein
MSQSPEKKKMSLDAKVGLGLIIGPFAGLVLVLVAYAITAFVVQGKIAAGAVYDSLVTFQLINVALGFIGVLCVLGIMLAVPIGIIMLVSSNRKGK